MGGTKWPSPSAFDSSVLSEIERQPRENLAVVELAESASEEVLRLSYAQLLSWADEILARIEAVKKEYEDHEGPKTVKTCDASGFLLVALVLDRSALALAAILAVWKAGGAYAPVPTDAPLARRKLLCSDADLLLTDKEDFCELHSWALLLPPRPEAPGFSGLPRKHLVMPDDMCMVIYTSGSTGQPKGVMCDHRCLWHSVSCFATDIGASSNTGLLWKTPYQWRTAEYELFAALCFGGVLHISPEGSQRQFRYLTEAVETHSISALTTVPSVLFLLVDHLGKCPSLNFVASVGEALPRELCRPFMDRTAVLQNYYGLTETGMTTWKCSCLPSGSIAPVGQPQPEVQVQLLSQPDGLPVEEGEIYFSGIMSRGYFKLPELTGERYHEVRGEYLFQTGDFGRWKNEQLEICGRRDAQVKLNGVRIELAEIEASLSAVCKEAAVVQAMEDAQTLVAFVAGARENLADFLSRHLPLYMIPVHFIHLDDLPRLANDKVDRNLLRARTHGLQSRAKAEAKLASGETDNEAELIKILDSLGFERLLNSKQMEMQRLCDNLSVLAMVNVILFHWFWCVLIDPETYPAGRAHIGGVVAMPKLEVNAWALYLYRLATQDWAYGVFMFAAAQMSTKQKTFTSRDAAIALLYFYTGVFPMIIAQLFHEPLSDIIFHAETVQRWFLLALLLGRATLIGGLCSGAGPVLQLVPLLSLYLLVPPCFSGGVDWCTAGGEYFLPTDWWPRCRSCLMTPKVLLSSLLFVGFSLFAPACARVMRRTKPWVAAVIFLLACILSQQLPSAQQAIEGDAQQPLWQQPAMRMAGLVLIVVQTLCLASCGRQVLWHLRWPAKYLMGSYLLNLNFLDAFFISPEVRWQILDAVQAVNGSGPLRGICLWITMLAPIVFFMFCAAPVLQTLLITWPWWLVSTTSSAVQRAADTLQRRRIRSSVRQPLLETRE